MLNAVVPVGGDSESRAGSSHGKKKPRQSKWSRFAQWMGGNRNAVKAILYMLFLCIFTKVVFQTQGTGETTFRMKEAIKEQLEGVYDRRNFVNPDDGGKEVGFEDVASFEDFFEYLQGTFADVVFQDSWYNDDSFTNNEAQWFNHNYKILGGVAMRQVRVKPDSCKVFDELSHLLSDCYGEYSEENEFKQDYGPADAPFKWTTASENGENSYSGRLARYYGGGYREVLPLNADRAVTEIIVGRLFQHRWADRATRAIFIDFNLYNPALDMLCLVKILFEFPSSGGSVRTINLRLVHVSHMLMRPSTITDLSWEGVMLGGVFAYIVSEIVQWWKRGTKQYFSNPWSYYDWFNFAIFAVAYGSRFTALNKAKSLPFPPGANEFVNYESPGFYIVQWKNFMAFNAFVTWFKMFKYLGQVPFMSHLLKVLGAAFPDVMTFMLCFFFVYVGAALAHLLAYGDEVAEYRTIAMCFYTLYIAILGDFDFPSMWESNRIMGPILFILWTLLALMILFNMFIAIIMEAYEQVKEKSGKVTVAEWGAKTVVNPIASYLEKRRERQKKDRMVQLMEGKLNGLLEEEPGAAEANSGLNLLKTSKSAHDKEMEPETKAKKAKGDSAPHVSSDTVPFVKGDSSAGKDVINHPVMDPEVMNKISSLELNTEALTRRSESIVKVLQTLAVEVGTLGHKIGVLLDTEANPLETTGVVE